MHYHPILFTKQVPWYKRLWYRRELRDINREINLHDTAHNLKPYDGNNDKDFRAIINKILALESGLNLPGKYCFTGGQYYYNQNDEPNPYIDFLNVIGKRKAGAFPNTTDEVDKLFGYINTKKAYIRFISAWISTDNNPGSYNAQYQKESLVDYLGRDHRFECYEIYDQIKNVNVRCNIRRVHGKKLKYLLDGDQNPKPYLKDELYNHFLVTGTVDFSDLETVYSVYDGFFKTSQGLNSTTDRFKMLYLMREKEVKWVEVKQQSQDAGLGFPFVRRWIERVKNWFSPTNHPTIKIAKELAEIREDAYPYMLIDEERTEVIKTLIQSKTQTYSVHTQQRVNNLSQAILGHGSDCIDAYTDLDAKILSIMSKHEFSDGVKLWHDFLKEKGLLTASNLQYYTVLRGLVENGYSLESILKTYDVCFKNLEGQGKLDNFVKNIPIFYSWEANDTFLNCEPQLIEKLPIILQINPDVRIEILRHIFRRSDDLKRILTDADHPQYNAIWTILESYYHNTTGNVSYLYNNFDQFLSSMLKLLKSGFSDFGVMGVSDSYQAYSLFSIIGTCPRDNHSTAIMKPKFAAMKANPQLIAVGNFLDKNYQNFSQRQSYKDFINEIQYLFLKADSINDVTEDLVKSAYYLRQLPSDAVAGNPRYDVSELMDCLMKIPNIFLVQINALILSIIEETPDRHQAEMYAIIKRHYAAYLRIVSDNTTNGQENRRFFNQLEDLYQQNRRNRNQQPAASRRRAVDVHNSDFTPARNNAYIGMKEKKQPRAIPVIRMDMSTCINAHQTFIRDALNNMIMTLISEKNHILVNKYFEHVYVRKFVIAAAESSAEFKTWFISALDRQVKQKGKDSSLSVWYDNATSPISDWKKSINEEFKHGQEPSISPEKYFTHNVPEIYKSLSWSELFTLADGVELCESEKLDSATTTIPNNSFLKSETSFDKQAAENILYLVWSYLMGKSTSAEVEALKLKVIISLGEIRAAYYHNSYDGNASISCPKGALERLLDTIAAEDPAFKAVIPPKAQGSPQAVNGVEASFDSVTISNYAMRSAMDKATAYLLSENCDVNQLSACYDAETKTWSISSSLWLKIESAVKAGIMAECGTRVSPEVSAMIESQMALFNAPHEPLYVYVEFSAEQARLLSVRLTELSGCSPKSTMLHARTAFMGEASTAAQAPPEHPLEKQTDVAKHDLS